MELTSSELYKTQKHLMKLARRRANRHNKQVFKRKEEEKLGSLIVAKTKTGLAPYNTRGNTEYLIKRGTTVLGERTLSGYRIYMGWQYYQTLKEVQEKCRSYIARKRELNIITKNYTL